MKYIWVLINYNAIARFWYNNVTYSIKKYIENYSSTGDNQFGLNNSVCSLYDRIKLDDCSSYHLNNFIDSQFDFCCDMLDELNLVAR